MFGAVCAGRPVQTNITTLSQTQFFFMLTPPINHLVVFLLPNHILPTTHCATIHIQFPGREFQLLGAISAEKPSAIFKVGKNDGGGSGEGSGGVDGGALAAAGAAAGEVMLGISVERAETVEEQLAAVRANKGGGEKKKVETLALARRIISNAFNFLSSFAENGQGGGEVVPLKSFHEWWGKFEKKIEYDPTFLERDERSPIP